MFWINKIHVYGFHSPEKEVIFEFADDNVTIAYGENGCGKTTLLQILSAIFSKDEEILFNHKVRKICMNIQHDGAKKEVCIEINHSMAEESTTLKKVHGYDWSELETLSQKRTLLLGVERNSIKATISPSVIYEYISNHPYARKIFENTDMNTRRAFAERMSEYINYSKKGRIRRDSITFEEDNLIINGSNVDISRIEDVIENCYNRTIHNASANIQSALFATLSQVVKKSGIDTGLKERKLFEEQLERSLSLISAAIEEIPEGRNNEILTIIKSADYKTIIKNCEENEHLNILLFNIVQSVKSEMVIFEGIQQLKNYFNEYTRKDKKITIDRLGVRVDIFKDNEVIGRHRITELSSGEKQLLTLLTCLFIDGKNRDLILIDEPELSLNMKWQNKLIDLFKHYAPNTQVIMATHSPSIAENHTECLRKLV